MYCIYLPIELGQSGIEKYDSNTFYRCLHNTILAHARVYRLYKEKYYSKFKGTRFHDPAVAIGLPVRQVAGVLVQTSKLMFLSSVQARLARLS